MPWPVELSFLSRNRHGTRGTVHPVSTDKTLMIYSVSPCVPFVPAHCGRLHDSLTLLGWWVLAARWLPQHAVRITTMQTRGREEFNILYCLTRSSRRYRSAMSACRARCRSCASSGCSCLAFDWTRTLASGPRRADPLLKVQPLSSERLRQNA